MIAFKKLGTLPISDESPAGDSVRYETVFDLIDSEISKLSSKPMEVDWEKVRDGAATILSDYSKDALVGSYLCVSLIHLKQPQEFVEALEGYRRMLENFWENLFPPRIKARISAVEWLVKRASDAFEKYGLLDDFSKKHVKKTQSIFEVLEETFAEYSADGDVDFVRVLRPLKVFLQKNKNVAELSDKAAETSSQVASESGVSSVSPALKPPPISGGKSPRSLLQYVRTLAKTFRDADPMDRKSYKLVRAATWELVDDLPPNNNGKTQISFPKNFIDFEKLTQEQNWDKLLADAEGKVYESAYTFCLDIHRHVAEALLRLGPNYKQARGAVCMETLDFVNRLSGVESLTFSDGTPFADSKTVWWINNELKSSVSLGGKQTAGGVRPLKLNSDKTVEETLSRALKMSGQGDQTPNVIRMIQRRLNMVASSKSKMRLRIGLNQILRGDKEFDAIVLANSEAILSDVTKFNLDQWDREFALDALMSVYDAYNSMKGKKYQLMAGEILRRIGLFDLVSAYNI